MKVEITIRVLGEENETAETLLGRVASLLRDQPSVLLETVGAKGESIAVKTSKEDEEDEESAPAEKPKSKRGRKSNAEKAAMAEAEPEKPSKKKKAEPEPEEDEEFDDIEELEDSDEGEDEEDEEPEEKPAKGKGKAKDKKGAGLTLEGDIIPAFRKFTGQHGNSAGAEVMKIFGVQSVRDLDDSDYPKVIEAIAAYKPKKKK